MPQAPRLPILDQYLLEQINGERSLFNQPLTDEEWDQLRGTGELRRGEVWADGEQALFHNMTARFGLVMVEDSPLTEIEIDEDRGFKTRFADDSEVTILFRYLYLRIGPMLKPQLQYAQMRLRKGRNAQIYRMREPGSELELHSSTRGALFPDAAEIWEVVGQPFFTASRLFQVSPTLVIRMMMEE